VKIGVLGGTFDPVHRGHIMMAEEAKKSLNLAEVLMVPAGQPMSRDRDNQVTSAEHRLEMLRLAVDDEPDVKISTVELERPGASYTVDTLSVLKQEYTGGDLYFILGWDSLEYIDRWRQPERIIELCRLVAIPRPGFGRPDLNLLEKTVPGIYNRVIFLDKPWVDISASAIRELASRGEPIGRLVPGEVAEYITKHKLYMAH
jgi:nicotinate-nucleotide adenylyltransferase